MSVRRIAGQWLVPGLLLIAGAGGGWWLLQAGFSSIQELRQLERVPASRVGAILPGEVVVNAVAQTHEDTLESFHTRTPSLYYHYKHERERTDSDGNTHWDTIDTREASVDFWLVDDTGKVRVAAREDRRHIDWSVRERFRNTVGADRYTERRVEAGDSLFVFARASAQDATAGSLVLRFNESGLYTPIISTGSQGAAQASLGGSGLLLLWGGLAGVALAVLGATLLLRIHRLLVYLTFLTMVLAVVLCQLSLVMMEQDIANGLTRYERQVAATAAVLDVSDGLQRREYRINLALAQARLERQMHNVPERWLLGSWGFRVPPVLDGVPEADQAEIVRRLEAIPDTRLTGWGTYLTCVFGAALALLFSVLGYRQVKFKRLIENIPTSTSIAVSCGLAESTGTVILDDNVRPLVSPHTDSECTWFDYQVEERRRSGKKVRWVTIESRTEHVNFHCEDDEGRLAVNPQDAEVISTHRVVETHGKRRYTETTLRLGDPLYAIGMAAIDADQPDRLILEKGAAFEPFILSNRAEADVMMRKARRGMVLLNLAFSGVLLALLLGLGTAGGFAATDFLFAALAAPVYMLVMMLVMHYNDLIYLRERAERNWSNIDVSLKKRSDLIKGLEAIARRYLDHERELQTQITRMRSSFDSAAGDRSQLARYLADEQSVASGLIGVVERYPDLQADTVMQGLMGSLSRMETEIAFLRQGYNDAVELFNTRIASVPDIVYARIFGFQALEFVRGSER